jgi:tRNA(adenine34) deaminase
MLDVDNPTLRKHYQFMTQAYYEAEKAFNLNEIPVGAVIVQNDIIIGRGHNMVESLGDPTAHAEMIAITAACESIGQKYLKNCTLYVTLEPCFMCSGASIWAKIDTIVFGASDEKAGSCGTLLNLAQHKRLNHSIKVIQGVMESDCSEILSRFFKKLRQSEV